MPENETEIVIYVHLSNTCESFFENDLTFLEISKRGRFAVECVSNDIF